MELLNWVLLALSTIVIISYGFDVLAHHSRIPSVVLLILCGLIARIVMDYINIKIPLLNLILPIIGTLGLILIVLEGALDLKIGVDNREVIARSFISAFLGIVLTGIAIATVIKYLFNTEWQQAWLYAVPLSVISSAVAIPAASNLAPKLKEFVVYESSLSDILGVLLFYIVLTGQGGFGLQAVTSVGTIGLSLLLGASSALLLYWLISRLESHVRFVPLIAGIALLYALGKILHLAPLIIVMVAGLMLNNMGLFHRYSFVRKIHRFNFREELDTFKHLVAEATFVVRTFFFVLLGYSTHIIELMDIYAWLLALVLLIFSLLPRAAIIYSCTKPRQLEPLIWFGPKGLITILLILTIPADQQITNFPASAVMLIILISAFLLTYGNIRYKKLNATEEQQNQPTPNTEE